MPTAITQALAAASEGRAWLVDLTLGRLMSSSPSGNQAAPISVEADLAGERSRRPRAEGASEMSDP